MTDSTWLIAGIFVASWVSGMTGLAFPTIATPLFLLLFSPMETVALTAACSLTGQIVSVLSLRRRIAYTLRWRLVLSGLAGVPVGIWLLSVVSVHVFGLIAGGIIALVSLWWLIRPDIEARAVHPALEILAGLGGGLSGGLIGLSAPLPTIWCVAHGLPKERQRAVLQPFILIVQLTLAVLLWRHGRLDRAVFDTYLLLLGPVIAGAHLGAWTFRAVSTEGFVRIALSLTVVSGVALMLRSVSLEATRPTTVSVVRDVPMEFK
jgi:uncharacterized membrane protein YfcA